jgi:excisionase family DNA binding protein
MKKNEASTQSLLISKRESAKAISISQRHLDNLIRARAIACVRVGGRVLIEREEIARFIARNRQEAHV